MYTSGDKDNNIFSHYTSQDLTIIATAPHFSPAAVYVPPPPVLENNSLKQLQLNLQASVSPTRKILPTHSFSKDVQRKILTAHGLRDRRVRLSMMVARKFFDLQDTLGFDKASETIGWLLTKSKPAIDELVKIKHNSSFTRKWSRSTSTEIGDKRNKYQHLKSKPIISSTLPVVDKESRAKARARARERTRTKLLIKNLSESKKVLPDFRIPQYHSSTWNNLSSHNNMVPYFQYLQAGDKLREGVRRSTNLL